MLAKGMLGLVGVWRGVGEEQGSVHHEHRHGFHGKEACCKSPVIKIERDNDIRQSNIKVMSAAYNCRQPYTYQLIRRLQFAKRTALLCTVYLTCENSLASILEVLDPVPWHSHSRAIHATMSLLTMP